MRFFTLIDFRHLILAAFLGMAVALAIYLAFRYKGQDNGGALPPVLLLLYIGFVLWMVSYVFFAVIGDRDPQSWDFGAVEDTPGRSAYSTHPEPGPDAGAPLPQHISDIPVRATTEKGSKAK